MKFEYKVHEYSKATQRVLEDEFNVLGEAGWELIDFDNEVHGFIRAIFKREKFDVK